MDSNHRNSGSHMGSDNTHDAAEASTLLPMLIGGLVLIVVGMTIVMWLT